MHNKRVLTILITITIFFLFSLTGGEIITEGSEKPKAPAIAITYAQDRPIEDTIVITIYGNQTDKGYSIYLKDTYNEKNYRHIKTIKKKNKKNITTYSITGLNYGEYDVKVRAYIKKGSKKIYSSYSEEEHIELRATLITKTLETENLIEKCYPELKKLADKGLIKIRHEARKDSIFLGKYDLVDENGIGDGKEEELEWEVLEYSKDGKSALVISKYLISNMAYSYSNSDDATFWENSNIRNWLNGSFYNYAFSDEEKSLIKNTKISTPDNENYGTKGGNDTNDYLFLLSYEEMTKYFGGKNHSSTCPYMYGMTGYWWLRSPGTDINNVRIAGHGRGCDGGDTTGKHIPRDMYRRVDLSGGVRPAFWIKLTDEIIENNNLSIDSLFSSTKFDTYVEIGKNYNLDSKSSEKEGILWQILDYDEENKKILLLSKFILCYKPYQDKDGLELLDWEHCSLRKWLNEEFIQLAFSEAERKLIKPTNIVNGLEQYCFETIDGGRNTIDNIFLLSAAEVNKYLKVAYIWETLNIMDYHNYNLLCTDSDNVEKAWVLRTPQLYIHQEGFVYGNLCDPYFTYSEPIRPAFWLDLDIQ